MPYWTTFFTDGLFNNRGPCGGRSVDGDLGARFFFTIGRFELCVFGRYVFGRYVFGGYVFECYY